MTDLSGPGLSDGERAKLLTMGIGPIGIIYVGMLLSAAYHRGYAKGRAEIAMQYERGAKRLHKMVVEELQHTKEFEMVEITDVE